MLLGNQGWDTFFIANNLVSSLIQWFPTAFSIYSIVFPLSTIPYLLFLRGLWKQKTVPVVSKLGFTYLLVFVFFSIIGSIAAMTWYHESLSNVDWIHGWAEQFLSVTVVTIYLGYRLAWNECLKEEELEEREE